MVRLVRCETAKKIIEKVKNTIFQFIWGSKWERVAKNKLSNDIKNDDANIVDLETHIITLRLNLMKKYLDDVYNSSWKEIERNIFSW